MLQYMALANPNYVTIKLHPALRPTHAPSPAQTQTCSSQICEDISRACRWKGVYL